MELLGEIKFKGDRDSTTKIISLVEHHCIPAANATKSKADGVYSKLTDTSLYTGSHKLRFDDDGKGRGLEGRETVSKTSELSQIVSRSAANISTKTSTKRSPTKSMDRIDHTPKKKVETNLKSKNNLSKSKGSVFDRLTDTQQYTGSHKERFDSNGKGRGLAGRT
jgi:hypothetical protein